MTEIMTELMTDSRPLIVHVIHRLDVGGMENGLVNLINHMAPEKYRHAVVSLTETTRFRERIRRDDVEHYALHKKPGHDLGVYVRLWRLLRRLAPAIVHTRNLASVEAVVPAAMAGVACRIHGEHGRDVPDIDGTRLRYRLLRRILSPLVHRFIALSRELEAYLVDKVGIPSSKITRIINGVDAERFHPASEKPRRLPEEAGFEAGDGVVVGTVTRMQEVKDPVTLARAFGRLDGNGSGRDVRLVMVGDGPLLGVVAGELEESSAKGHVWLAGNRDDVPELVRGFDVFALSSRVEGISNTVLEAMASGLPVVATRVGGNDELVEDGTTGFLVPSGSPEAMAEALARYVDSPELRRRHGAAARRRAESELGIDEMVARYTKVYDDAMIECGLVSTESIDERSTTTSCAG